jgi:hypothetical protein
MIIFLIDLSHIPIKPTPWASEELLQGYEFIIQEITPILSYQFLLPARQFRDIANGSYLRSSLRSGLNFVQEAHSTVHTQSVGGLDFL